MKKHLLFVLIMAFIVGCSKENIEPSNPTAISAMEVSIEEITLTTEQVNSLLCYLEKELMMNTRSVKTISSIDYLFGHDGPLLLFFSASWCGPCRMMMPIIEELSNEFEGRMTFCRVDVAESPDMAVNFTVRSVPTIMIFRDFAVSSNGSWGGTKFTCVGPKSKQVLRDLILYTLP